MPITAASTNSYIAPLSQPASLQNKPTTENNFCQHVHSIGPSPEGIIFREQCKQAYIMMKNAKEDIIKTADSNMRSGEKLNHYIFDGSIIREAATQINNACQREGTTPEDERAKGNDLPFAVLNAQRCVPALVNTYLSRDMHPLLRQKVLDNFSAVRF